MFTIVFEEFVTVRIHPVVNPEVVVGARLGIAGSGAIAITCVIGDDHVIDEVFNIHQLLNRCTGISVAASA